VPLETAIPLGLVVNELVSNCLKHAFPDQRAGVVYVEAKAIDDERIEISVRDDGVGIAQDIEPASASTLGLQIIRALTGQLGGEVTFVAGQGTEVRLRV
jgi:two-component sensor histidine kinase